MNAYKRHRHWFIKHGDNEFYAQSGSILDFYRFDYGVVWNWREISTHGSRSYFYDIEVPNRRVRRINPRAKEATQKK